MIVFVTWLWGDKYNEVDVLKLFGGIRRHMRNPFRFLVMTDRERQLTMFKAVEQHAIRDPALLQHRGCFARLRVFDPGWQQERGITANDRLVSIDLDVLIVAHLDPVFDRAESFVILQDVNSVNPCPFNGSLWMIEPGQHADVWHDFTLERANAVPFHEFPDDQGWLHHKIPAAGAWRPNDGRGVFAFQKPGWPARNAMPHNARVICFTGWRKPRKFQYLDWVTANWRYP